MTRHGMRNLSRAAFIIMSESDRLSKRGVIKMLYRLCLLCLIILSGCSAASVPTTAEPAATPSPPAATTPVVVSPTLALPTPVPTLSPTATAPAPTLPPTATAPAPTAAPVTVIVSAYPEEILFLRNQVLIAIDPATGRERTLAEAVRDVALDPSGRWIAAAGDQELLMIDRRDGSSRSLIRGRAVHGLSWAADGQALAFASAAEPPRLPFDWERWSRWCAAATVAILDLPTNTERTIGVGCDPVFASDARRLAYVTPPTSQPDFLPFPGQSNAIRLVNRAGANAWNFAIADGSVEQGYLVYAPSWSPDAQEVAYQRFLGYQALVDINLTMIAESSTGGGVPVVAGAGWHRPAVFAPDGQTLATIEHNFSDARGMTGYDIWQLALIDLRGERREALPSGDISLRGQIVARIPRITAVAWSPDGNRLAALTPAGWDPATNRNEPRYEQEDAGEIWQLSPQGQPERRLASEVDFASPLIWAPAGLVVAQAGAARIAFPDGWELLPTSSAGELIAAAGGRAVGYWPVTDPALLSATAWSQVVADQITVEQTDQPYQLPDRSQLIGFSGRSADGSAISGVARLVAEPASIVVSYAPRAEWSRLRAIGIALATAP